MWIYCYSYLFWQGMKGNQWVTVRWISVKWINLHWSEFSFCSNKNSVQTKGPLPACQLKFLETKQYGLHLIKMLCNTVCIHLSLLSWYSFWEYKYLNFNCCWILDSFLWGHFTNFYPFSTFNCNSTNGKLPSNGIA